MSNAANIALTALSSFVRKLDVTANNIANVNTEDFKKSRAVLEEAYPSGVKVSVSQVNTPGMSLPADESHPDSKETSNVVLEDELVDLIVTQHMYDANLTTIRTEEEMRGTVLDLIV
jgi:flagellar basal-body rod protein FlgC